MPPARRRESAALLGVALLLLGLGLWWDTWPTIAGGLIAALTAAWVATEPDQTG